MTLWRIANKFNEKTVGDVIIKKVLVTPLKKIIELQLININHVMHVILKLK